MSLNRPMGINSDVLNTKVQHINTITGIHSRRAIRLRVHPFLFSIVNYSKQSILKNTGCRPGKAPPLTDPVCGFVPAAATDGHKRISDRSGAKLRHPVRTESDPPPAKEIQEPSDADSTSGAYFFSGAKITDILPFCPSHPDFLVRQVPKLPGFTRFKSEKRGTHPCRMRPSPKQLSLQTQNPHSSGTGIRVFTSSGTSGKKVMPIFSSMKLTAESVYPCCPTSYATPS